MQIKDCTRALACAALALLTSTAAQAATPDSGTLTLESGPIEFSEGPNFGVNLTPQTGSPECVDTVLPCDHFSLTVDLPDNTVEFFPGALIRMVFTWDDPLGGGAEDYDIYLRDAGGNQVNSAATGSQPEVMVQLANGGVEEYTIDVVFFSVTGSTYTGRIELDLGEPADGKDPDDFFSENNVFGHLLQNQVTEAVAQATGEDEQDAEARDSSYVQRRSASGALGLGSLILGLLILVRRRG